MRASENIMLASYNTPFQSLRWRERLNVRRNSRRTKKQKWFNAVW